MGEDNFIKTLQRGALWRVLRRLGWENIKPVWRMTPLAPLVLMSPVQLWLAEPCLSFIKPIMDPVMATWSPAGGFHSNRTVVAHCFCSHWKHKTRNPKWLERNRDFWMVRSNQSVDSTLQPSREACASQPKYLPFSWSIYASLLKHAPLLPDAPPSPETSTFLSWSNYLPLLKDLSPDTSTSLSSSMPLSQTHACPFSIRRVGLISMEVSSATPQKIQTLKLSFWSAPLGRDRDAVKLSVSAPNPFPHRPLSRPVIMIWTSTNEHVINQTSEIYTASKSLWGQSDRISTTLPTA